ncbi:MAG: AI-2E family transporter [Ornithinimicrobium sp.]
MAQPSDAPAGPFSALAAPSALPRGVLIMVGLAATVITVAGLKAVADIIGPVFLALVLSIAASPLATGLARRGVPRWVGTVVSILTIYISLLLLAGLTVVALARFASLVPGYQDELRSVLAGVRDRLLGFGVDPEQISTLLDSFDLGRLAALIGSLLGSLLAVVTNLGFVAALVLFVCFDAASFGRHLDRIRVARPAFVEAMESFAQGTKTYLLVSTGFGLIVAIIDTLLLWALGVPAPVLWGLLAFITNYIPNIGFVLGLLPPAILGLLEGGPGLMLTVIAAYSVINVVIQSVIQPKIVGDAVGLSASITFLSLVVWTWILGPLGAVLAVPLSLLARALLIDVDPRAHWVSGLIGTPKVVDDPVVLPNGTDETDETTRTPEGPTPPAARS